MKNDVDMRPDAQPSGGSTLAADASERLDKVKAAAKTLELDLSGRVMRRWELQNAVLDFARKVAKM